MQSCRKKSPRKGLGPIEDCEVCCSSVEPTQSALSRLGRESEIFCIQRQQRIEEREGEKSTAAKTAKERVKSSPASTDLSLDKAKPGAPTNLVDLMSVGIPYQRNGVVYLQGDNSNNKRKASALEQGFVRDTK